MPPTVFKYVFPNQQVTPPFFKRKQQITTNSSAEAVSLYCRLSVDETELDVRTDLMGGRTGWEKRLDVETGERGARGGVHGSAMPMRLAASFSRSMTSLDVNVRDGDVVLWIVYAYCSSDRPGRWTGFFSKLNGSD